MFELIQPTADLHQSWLAAHREWGPGLHEDGFGLGPMDEVETQDGFAKWVRRLERKPASMWWIVNGETVLGGIVLRAFTDGKTPRTGHIGYGVRPSARGLGVAGWALTEVLERARTHGMSHVLLVCREDNLASIRTIERCGAVHEATLTDEGRSARRYRIDLGRPVTTP